MSLVAAYSESESEGENDNVDISTEIPKKEINSKLQVRDETPLFEIEDEDEWEQSVPTTTSTDQLDRAEIFSSLPAPSTSNFSLKEEEEEENEDEFLRKKPNKEDVLFKKEQALLEKELKENKKNSGSKDSKHFLSKFTMGGSKKKHVMISIPTLEEV